MGVGALPALFRAEWLVQRPLGEEEIVFAAPPPGTSSSGLWSQCVKVALGAGACAGLDLAVGTPS